MSRIEELKTLITKYDKAYRIGDSIVPDSVYDELVDELVDLIGDDDAFFNSSIKDDTDDLVNSDRREPLPIIMASLDKKKVLDDIYKWVKLKNIPNNIDYIVMPKYDGISLATEETTSNNTKKSWTRGGRSSEIGGLRSEKHLLAMGDIHIDAPYTYGEVMVSKNNWNIISSEFDSDSPRNAVSGIFRRDDITDLLDYVDFIRYGVVGKEFTSKSEQLDFLNKTQKIKVPYKILKLHEISEDLLYSLFLDYSKDYILDGLVIEVNDSSISKSLGRSKSKNNPNFAIAYKSKNFEENATTNVTDIEYNISKNGNIIPTCIFKSVSLGGTTVSRATLNNCSYMKEIGINISSIITVTKSGGIIPLITKVLEKKEFTLPDIECYWEGVHLKTLYETDEQKIKKNHAFFKILGVENASDKTFELLFNSGFKTIKDILSMNKSDFLSLERFGEAKADKIYDSIFSKLSNVSLSKLQHATGLFNGNTGGSLGSKKLLLLEHFTDKPSEDDITKIEGFSTISAQIYLDNIDKFWEFIKYLPITIQKTVKIEASSNELEGQSFCFSGIRSKQLEDIIISRSGTIASGVSKKLTFLIMKEIGTGSSKEVKALDLGVKVLTIEDLKILLNV